MPFEINKIKAINKMWSFFSRDQSKDFPYEIGEQVHGLESKSIWSLHRGKKKNTTEEQLVSVFVYDIKSGSDTKLEILRHSIKKLKTLRHPCLLQFLDSLETDKVLYVATELVEPLGTYIEHLDMGSPQKDLYLAWGIFQVTVSDLYRFFYSLFQSELVRFSVHFANICCFGCVNKVLINYAKRKKLVEKSK